MHSTCQPNIKRTMSFYASTEEEENRRYRREIETMEERWSNDDFTDQEDYEFRKYGFDDLMYDELYKKHQRNLRRIRRRSNRRNNHSQVTLWDFIQYAEH